MYTYESHGGCVIVHNSRSCPMCDIEKELADVVEQRDKLVADMVDLQDELDDLKDLVSVEAPQLLY